MLLHLVLAGDLLANDLDGAIRKHLSLRDLAYGEDVWKKDSNCRFRIPPITERFSRSFPPEDLRIWGFGVSPGLPKPNIRRSFVRSCVRPSVRPSVCPFVPSPP